MKIVKLNINDDIHDNVTLELFFSSFGRFECFGIWFVDSIDYPVFSFKYPNTDSKSTYNDHLKTSKLLYFNSYERLVFNKKLCELQEGDQITIVLQDYDINWKNTYTTNKGRYLMYVDSVK